MSASARADQCALSHASAQCIVAPAKPTSATSNVSEACRRANSARMAYAIANGQTSRRSRQGTRAYRRTSRTSPPSASLADADAIADVEWSRCGSTTPRTSDDGLSRALHSSDDDEHFGKARFVHPTSTSLLHLARIRGGFDSSNFRVSGRAFRFRSAFLSCGYLLWSDSVRVVRGRTFARCRMTPSSEKARSKSSGESPPRGSDIDNDLGRALSATTHSLARRVRASYRGRSRNRRPGRDAARATARPRSDARARVR